MFTPIDPKVRVDAREKEIQKFWEENDTFVKTVDGEDGKSRKNRESYTFYDGPPFATGLPHYGHLVGGTIKDVVPRYQTMCGKRVERKWGWDCHGLPIENIVEKELGSKSKKDIEKMGVAKFNETCRSKVLEYASEWEKIVPRLGRWVDMGAPYRTMDRDYMESVWWVFKNIYDKGLVYESYRSMHVCPRCETTLSQSEVSEGYKDIKDLSVIAKFKVKANQRVGSWTIGKDENVYILAWTTTPWTLPGNVALAVGKDIEYVGVKNDCEYLILAKGIYEHDLIEQKLPFLRVKELSESEEPPVIATDTEVKFRAGKITGEDLIGLSYEPLYDTYAKDKNLENSENGWKVVTADFVTTEDGTGVVHIAPAFGEDDMALGKEKALPFIQHVGMNGIIDGSVGYFAGLSKSDIKPRANGKANDIREIDITVVKDLAKRGLLFHKEKYTHSYPHCWRCDTALLNYATSSWFVNVTKIKDKLLKDAEKINWSPEHIKDGRFGKWLEGARDWSISRQRFWASVIPIWVCNTCGEKNVFGTVADLEKISGQKIDDIHKHIVDNITFDCEKCLAQGKNGVMTRVPDVLDTWFDSASMPYAQEHYMGGDADSRAMKNGYPADFIAEGVDQTRAWFYYLHVLAGALEVGGENDDKSTHAFKNVIVNGIVLAEDGKKMSKSLQNYPDPMKMVQKYGADALRLYLMSAPVVAAENLRFSEKDLSELSRGLFRMLRQSYSFFVMYANVDGWKLSGAYSAPQFDDASNILDKWIVARLQQVIGEVNTHMENYELHRAGRAFVPFVDDLSNWHIRRSRKRFWKSEDDSDKDVAYTTLHYVLVELAKLMAPFTPFIAEEIYKNLTNSESVHLENFPKMDKRMIDEKLIEQMSQTRNVITKTLELRARASIKVRQPLATLSIKENLSDDFVNIIKEEINVKNVILDTDALTLDTEITPELKLEGQAREIIRHIQQARKKAGFNVDDRIVLGHEGMKEVFEKHREMIAHEVLAKKVVSGNVDSEEYASSVKIDGDDLTISLARV